jgi:hypothetical protein
MIRNCWKSLLAAGLLCSAPAIARGQQEQQAYCTYLMEQAQAQRNLLRTPTATAGFTQPETGLPMQLVGGATLGLSDVRKAELTMEVARKNCELYKASTGAQQEIQYAVASLEKEALLNRLALIEQASKSLDTLIAQTAKMLEVQNATQLMLFTLQTTKIRLEADRADTHSKLSAVYVPALSDQSLKELVTQKQNSEEGAQRVLDKLSRQNNWDVALTVGVHQQVNPVAQGAQPYGQVSVSYNLASRSINRHLDRAVEAHGEWKKVEESDVVRQMEVLRQQLVECAMVQETKLKSLEEESKQLDKNLQLVAAPDTSAAFDFHNQLAATQLMLQIETGDAAFRIGRLHEYLARNY